MQNRKERALTLLAGNGAALWFIFPNLATRSACITNLSDAFSMGILIWIPVAGVVCAWFALVHANPEAVADQRHGYFEGVAALAMALCLLLAAMIPFTQVISDSTKPQPTAYDRCIRDLSANAAVPRE